MRLPFAPLDALAAKEGVIDLARWLGVSGRAVERLRTKGVPVAYADRLAVRVGVHPWFLWGDAFWADLPEWVFGRLEAELAGSGWAA